MLCNFMNYQKYTISIIFKTNYNLYSRTVRAAAGTLHRIKAIFILIIIN